VLCVTSLSAGVLCLSSACLGVAKRLSHAPAASHNHHHSCCPRVCSLTIDYPLITDTASSSYTPPLSALLSSPPTSPAASSCPTTTDPRISHFHMHRRHARLCPAATRARCRLPSQTGTPITTFRPEPHHHMQHTSWALPSRQHTLTTISLLRRRLRQQRPKSYYGLGRNRRGKLSLRPEPDPRPLPTNLPRPSTYTIA
jgi:hypothetical protein